MEKSEMIDAALARAVLAYGQKQMIEIIKYIPDPYISAHIATVVLQRDAGKFFSKYVYDQEVGRVMTTKEYIAWKEEKLILDELRRGVR